MPQNYPGPYEVEYVIAVPSTNGTLEHSIRFNCALVGTPTTGLNFNTMQVMAKNGSPLNLEFAVQEMWGFIRQRYKTDVSVVGVTLWRYAPGTYAKTFVSELSSALLAGESVGTTKPAGQMTLTFRSAGGGILKVTLLETADTGDNRTPLVPSTAGNQIQRFAAYILAGNSWILARDDTFPIAALRDVRGQNEAIFKKRFRRQ